MSNPLVGLTEHRGSDGRLWIVAVNYDCKPIRSPYTLAGRIDSVYGRATVSDGLLCLGANEGCVIGIGK